MNVSVKYFNICVTIDCMCMYCQIKLKNNPKMAKSLLKMILIPLLYSYFLKWCEVHHLNNTPENSQYDKFLYLPPWVNRMVLLNKTALICITFSVIYLFESFICVFCDLTFYCLSLSQHNCAQARRWLYVINSDISI